MPDMSLLRTMNNDAI